MKKRRLKKWVRVVINILGVAAFMYLFHLAFRVTPKETDMIDACMEHGGTLAECRKGVLGIYE